jgi:hypothetical protein
MDKRIIKGLIDEKLEVIQEQFSIIREYQGKIPNIELDLFMNSIRDLYELVLSLQLENMGGVTPKQAPQPGTHKEVPPPEPRKVEKIPEEMPPVVEMPVVKPVEKEPMVEKPDTPVRLSHGIISMEPVTGAEPEMEPPAVEEIIEIDPEQEIEPEEPLIPEPEPISEPPVEEQTPERPQEKFQRITMDLFSDGAGSTIADRLRAGEEKRIADKLQENKGADLRITIGINDKFLFINELFEGNMRIYDDTVQKLNTCATIAQADLLLLDLKIVYNWDSESPTVKKFVELVRRKF